MHKLETSAIAISKAMAEGRDLGQNIKKLDHHFGNSSDCVFLKDRSKRLVFANKSFHTHYVRHGGSPIGLTGSRFLPKSMRELSHHSDEALAKGCHRIRLEYDVVGDGLTKMRSATIKLPLHDGDGNFQGIIGLSQPHAPSNRIDPPESLQRLGETLNKMRPEERQVAKLVCNGLPNKSIARKLGTSVRTVENRRHNILKKLDIGTTAEFIKLAVRLEDAGLVALDI